jgi:hypothetical protein
MISIFFIWCKNTLDRLVSSEMMEYMDKFNDSKGLEMI